jgi:HEAT repeat protein
VSAFPILRKIFESEEHNDSYELLNAVVRLGGAEMVNDLLRRLPTMSRDQRWRVMHVLYYSTERQTDKQFVEPLTACLDPHPANWYDHYLQMGLVQLLQSIGDPSAIKPLREMLDQTTSGELHNTILRALDDLETTNALPAQ